MIISWQGFNYFRIQNSQQSIVFNPYSLDSTTKYGKVKADIAIFSNPKAVTGCKMDEETLVVSAPGEYEVKDVFVYGQAINGQAIYLVIFESIRIAFLGEFGHNELTDKDLELIEGADILILPVGGGEFSTAKEANKIIGQVEPRVVIPSCFSTKGFKFKVDGVDAFVKEFGASTENMDKWKFSKKDLPQEDVKVIILEPQL